MDEKMIFNIKMMIEFMRNGGDFHQIQKAPSEAELIEIEKALGIGGLNERTYEEQEIIYERTINTLHGKSLWALGLNSLMDELLTKVGYLLEEHKEEGVRDLGYLLSHSGIEMDNYTETKSRLQSYIELIK